MRDRIAERRRVEDERIAKHELAVKELDIKLKPMTFKVATANNKYEEKACCICFEDFTDDALVRETPCLHIFHSDCLMGWIQSKVGEPDCPFCRAEMKTDKANVL